MTKDWQVASAVPPALVELFADYPSLFAQLFFNRGILNQNAAVDFLADDPRRLFFDPFLFRAMAEAVQLAIEHIKTGHPIVVYGDYDADGVTASALLTEILRTLRARADHYIPDRISEGYGLNEAAIDYLAKKGTKLIITVDNGIRNKLEIERARALGMDIIVTDHHLPPDESSDLPDCLIINPHSRGETYPEKKLAGVGVAFKFAGALIQKSTLSAEKKDKLIGRLLDLVAIGTITDCVSLTGENRALVKSGLAVLSRQQRPGLKALIREAGISDDKKIDAWHIGFQLGPRLNAAGRLDHANTSFHLLITRDDQEAASLARTLNANNQVRQRLTDEILAAADQDLDPAEKGKNIIIARSPNLKDGVEAWNEGVIGLAAGRLCERYYRPALVLTKREAEVKGSGRSVAELNLMAMLEKVREYLARWGGHAAACGFTLKSDRPEFVQEFIAAVKQAANDLLAGKIFSPRLLIDAEFGLENWTEKIIADLDRFAPFGEDNPQPKFLSRGLRLLDVQLMGNESQHIKLRLKSETSPIFSALGFGRSEDWKNLPIGGKIDMVYYTQINEFNGRREIQLKIIDIKPSAA